MKKLFVIALATAALASCSKVEPIEPGYKSAIGFNKSFVDNSTKALIDNSNIANFAVWGTEEGEPIFANDDVTGTYGGDWTYTATKRYWHTGNDYVFAAVAPADQGDKVTALAAGLPSTAEYTLATTLAEQVDLLYATASVADVAEGYNTAVGFTFAHQLAKVDFHIKNSYPAGYTVRIDDLKIKASKSATVTFPGAWSAHAALADDFKLPFEIATIATNATGVSNQSLIIPKAAWATAGDIFYTVEGTATVVMGSTDVETISLAYELKDELKAGFHYNITADVTPGNPIEFNVTGVNGFTTATPDVAM